MVILKRQQQSLEAYLKLLESKGADQENLSRRRVLLEQFLPLLANRPAKGEHYRKAVDECMTLIDRKDWPFFLQLVREYYYFWNNDFKAIAMLCKEDAFNTWPEIFRTPAKSLKELWEQMDSESFSAGEKWPLNAYRAVLREDGADTRMIETRSKMVKLLLLQLRHAEDRSGRIYRAAVDSMLPLFTKMETSALFLEVVREFFPFWIGNPDAAHVYSDMRQTSYAWK